MQNNDSFFYWTLALLLSMAILFYKCAGTDIDKVCSDLASANGAKYLRAERLYFFGVPYAIQCYGNGPENQETIQKWP